MRQLLCGTWALVLSSLFLYAPSARAVTLLDAVEAALHGVCANCIASISTPDVANPATWVLTFTPGTLDTVERQAQAVLTNFPLATWNAQQAAQAAGQATLAAGLTIKSTAYPALDGTYSVTPAATGNISSVELYIEVHQTFPGGATTMPWLDAAGAPHVFPSVAEFQAFATAAADFVAAVSLGQSYAQPATIP